MSSEQVLELRTGGKKCCDKTVSKDGSTKLLGFPRNIDPDRSKRMSNLWRNTLESQQRVRKTRRHHHYRVQYYCILNEYLPHNRRGEIETPSLTPVYIPIEGRENREVVS
jgi:hypothetical protein